MSLEKKRKLFLVLVNHDSFCNSVKHVYLHTCTVSVQTSSKARLRYLDQLHAFVVAATKELMWLNEKEEEEVNYDWSDKNTNMTAKKDNYSVQRRSRVWRFDAGSSTESDHCVVLWLL